MVPPVYSHLYWVGPIRILAFVYPNPVPVFSQLVVQIHPGSVFFRIPGVVGCRYRGSRPAVAYVGVKVGPQNRGIAVMGRTFAPLLIEAGELCHLVHGVCGERYLRPVPVQHGDVGPYLAPSFDAGRRYASWIQAVVRRAFDEGRHDHVAVVEQRHVQRVVAVVQRPVLRARGVFDYCYCCVVAVPYRPVRRRSGKHRQGRLRRAILVYGVHRPYVVRHLDFPGRLVSASCVVVDHFEL